jgi:hypothetical protein
MKLISRLVVVLGITTSLSFNALPSVYASPQCAASNQRPLTKARLEVLAIEHNAVKPGLPPSEFEKQVGRAFQNFALGTIDPARGIIPENTTPYYSPLREEKTKNKYRNVIPDGVVELTYVDLTTGVTKLIPEGVFYEVKAVSGKNSSLAPGTEEWQIGGIVDALSESDAAKTSGAAVPAVIFLTTSDVRIGNKLRLQAFFNFIALWHSMACEIPPFDNNPPENYLQLGELDPVNPEVYILQLTIPKTPGSGRPGKLPSFENSCPDGAEICA